MQYIVTDPFGMSHARMQHAVLARKSLPEVGLVSHAPDECIERQDVGASQAERQRAQRTPNELENLHGETGPPSLHGDDEAEHHASDAVHIRRPNEQAPTLTKPGAFINDGFFRVTLAGVVAATIKAERHLHCSSNLRCYAVSWRSYDTLSLPPSGLARL